MIADDTRKLIDDMSYEQMLRLYRFEPSGSPWFTGEVGDYFHLMMLEKKNALSNEEQVEISKRVGWERPS